jgi:hypothetical protein
MNGTVDSEFEQLVKPFLAAHPEVRCEWRTVPSHLAGDRRDLICAAGTSREVFATLRPSEAVVGSPDGHDDYQDFGTGQADAALAREAFERFVALLREHGHLDQAL